MILAVTINPGLCKDNSAIKKDHVENGSSLKDTLRKVSTSIQEEAKKVGETFQKGYETVKKKVSEMSDNDGKSKDQLPKVQLPKDQPGVIAAENNQDNSNNTDGGKVDAINATVDNRFLFDTPQKCPPGQTTDHGNHCRRS